MGNDEYRADVAAIQALIARQFGSLCWAPGKQAAWGVLAGDFHPDASLYPAARPAQRQTVQAFSRADAGLGGDKTVLVRGSRPGLRGPCLALA